MKILLIYPQYSHSTEFDTRAPSMSLVYLASALERDGHQVEIYDASLGPVVKFGKIFRYGVSEKEMADFLRNRQFDVVGITCSFAAKWKFVSRIAEQIKELNPRVPVAIGGLFPTYSWKKCLEDCKAIDFIMLGEAELSFARIINNFAKGGDINDACKSGDGVAWRAGKEFCCNQKKEYNNKLDDLPFPAWHLADLKKYFLLQKNIFELVAPCLPILSSRSCPNRCSFCNMYLTHGRVWRPRSADNVLDEIEYLIKKFGVRNFYFIDDNFSIDVKRAKNICLGLIERKLNIRYNFHNGLSIKTIDGELVQLMKKSGCTSVCLAIESGSERIRNGVYKKNISAEKIEEVFNLFHKFKIPTVGYFMLGAPGETRADFEETKKLSAKLPMSLITSSIFTPYPETALYDECKKKGWLLEDNSDKADWVEMYTPMLKTPDFEPKDLIAWQKELYYSFIWHHWPALVMEVLRPGGIVNLDTIKRFIGFTKFSLSRIINSIKNFNE
ncbi:MAG: hypothetical protein A3A98_02395 [Candidatus Staskawiczbacteria bacterium RIFCSPLOWO2_01_FULL_40_39]|nr:MAG: hypothetical protein A3A98_02395 [Candidatus Staskawiczbacteria bacterium RIFCSPLOWO2_01_FULL_40_39]